MQNNKPWPLLERKKIGDFRIFSLHNELYRMPDNRQHNFFVMECNDWVNIVPVTKDNKVVLIRQFRPGTKEITIEIPGGMVEPDESPQNAALRELQEETGYRPKSMEYVGVVEPNPAFIRNKCHMFLARDAELVSDQNLDPGEVISFETATWDQIDEYVKTGKILHGLMLNALCFARTAWARNVQDTGDNEAV